jgi:S1-C subfamily serine protease
MKNKFLIVWVVISVLLWWIFLKNIIFSSQPSPLEEIQGWEEKIVTIIEKNQMDIYRSDPYNFMQQIVWQTEVKSWFWKGFFVSDNWYILTAKHVVNIPWAQYSVVLDDKQEFLAEIITLFSEKDLALLKIDTAWAAVPYLELQETQEDDSIIQTKLSLKQWDSWSPLYNEQGKVLWVNISTDLVLEDVSFATQVSYEILEKYLENK